MNRKDKMYYAIQDEVHRHDCDFEWIEEVFKDFFGDTPEDEKRVLDQITE